MTFELRSKAGLTPGVSWLIGEAPLIIGRDPACDIPIMDNLVSRRHCEIRMDGQQVTLTDLGSRNTTLVNGRPVDICALHVGDEISVGRARLALMPLANHTPPVKGERSGGSTVSLHTTRAIFVSQDKEAWLRAERKQTVNDLADLFSLSRAFWDVKTSAHLIEIFVNWLEKRYTPSYLWLVEFDKSDSGMRFLSVSGAGHEAKWPKAEPHLVKAAAADEGICTALSIRRIGATTVETLLCAPMRLRQQVTGAVVLISSTATAAYDESDLQLLMAAVNTAAPWFEIVGAVERLQFDNAQLRRARAAGSPLIGESAAMDRVRTAICKAARTELPVLIEGETGTGKDLAARMIHDMSSRAEGPFVAINCAAIPAHLIESEMFGHERGAFTGAGKRKRGFFESAHRGTLFLDEIGELRPEHQSSLLRVLETGVFRTVGGEQEIAVSVRIVSATNKPLRALVAKGAFREDLLFRLNGYAIEMPPLRERPSDILPLARHFLDALAGRTGAAAFPLTAEAERALETRRWPGNVRELRAVVERAAALADGDRIEATDLTPTYGAGPAGEPLTLHDVERLHILKILDQCNGRIGDAARILGIGRTTLYDKLSKYKESEGTIDA